MLSALIEPAPLYPVGHIFATDEDVMRYAVSVAARGIGRVEPNPPVGAVVVDENRRLISAGWHQKYGDAHAEVNAIAGAQGQTSGQQLFVTLEPCNHTGKTPPCSAAVIKAGFRRVVIGCPDPADHKSDGAARSGIDELRAAGIDVTTGVCEDEARQLIAPFTRLMTTGLPWIHAKWAMTLDGRMASRTGHSKWITGPDSRAAVHRLRGYMQAIVTGAGTVRADNPLLTPRGNGPRTPLRVVIDPDADSLADSSQLLQTIDTAPVLVFVAEAHRHQPHVQRLEQLGVEIAVGCFDTPRQTAAAVAAELGRQKLTHVLLEGGPTLLGSFFDAGLVNQVHAWIAPKIVGGQDALPVVGGLGREQIPELADLSPMAVHRFENDLLVEGCIRSDG